MLRADRAALLGALHGPAELVPVSSSAHVALVPWLAGWEEAELDPALRKALEVALHAGTAVGLLWLQRAEVAGMLGALDRRRLGVLALSLLPPALVGAALQRPIEERLGTPRAIAAGLVAGTLALLAAEARGDRGRGAAEAGVLDGLTLGLAQASALVPGVSRCGATLAAARARGFDRPAASALSWEVALPVLGAATALEGVRLAQAPPPPEVRRALLAGAAAALASTLAAAPLLHAVQRGPWWPYGAWRLGLAAAAALKARSA